MTQTIAFIGGGNMASAIIGGLIHQGTAAHNILVVEPFDEARAKLKSQFGIDATSSPDATLARAGLVVWAVKPQTFKDAALQARSHTASALHLSVAAGIRSDSIAAWLGSERIIRCMPNTPALIGKGMTALVARDGVSSADKEWAGQVIATYMFYFMEAMTDAGAEMGLTKDQAYQLAVATFIGAGELARASTEPPEVLRSRVTSKGGTTYAAITSMDESGIKARFAKALHAARDRAQEMGDAFGKA